MRTLDHAEIGKDGRPTKSFTLSDSADRAWWKTHHGHNVRIELLAVEGRRPPEPVRSSATSTTPKTPDRPATQLPKPTETESEVGSFGSVLCIGLDIAWFGGSANNPDSQYDCLAAVHLLPARNPAERAKCTFARIRLDERDSDAKQLLQGLADLLHAHPGVGRIVLALDAPLQAAARDDLPARKALSTPGTIKRRACENYLSEHRQRVDTAAGGSGGWHPNIQPGAPLAPRVISFLEGLNKLGFEPWTQQNQLSRRLVIECFPAEAIWAAKRLGRYADAVPVSQVKAYKNQGKALLTAERVRTLVLDVVDAFAEASGDIQVWSKVLDAGLSWLLADDTWKSNDPRLFRGGKLLDDVVDSLICLATSLSYVHGQSHVWQDPNHTNDGHIIGPGRLDGLL